MTFPGDEKPSSLSDQSVDGNVAGVTMTIGRIRTLASIAGILLALSAGQPDAAQKTAVVRALESGKRPEVEFMAEGDRVFRVVPPDAINALDQPEMIPAGEVSGIMGDAEPVLAVFDGGVARAWSTWMLDSREVVNDHLGEIPIAATWCPLANTGVVFVRSIDGEETTFGVSGALWRDALVLFDRKTHTYWSQVTGLAIRGPREGARLVEIPSVTTTWGAWRRLHPDTLILRPDAASRDGSPLAGYIDDPEQIGITRSIKPDPRLPGKSLVLGISDAGKSTAVPVDTLASLGVVQGRVGETPVAIVSVATRGGFGYDRRLSARTLDFERNQDGLLRDLQTGSTWDPESGRALTGALAGESLRRVDSRSAYWFTWASFHPSTEIVGLDHRGEPPLE